MKVPMLYFSSASSPELVLLISVILTLYQFIEATSVVVYTEDFSTLSSGASYLAGSQYGTGLPCRAVATLPGWSSYGDNAIHAVSTSPIAVMIWSGGPNTLISPPIAHSNVAGLVYSLTFYTGPAVYVNYWEATSSSDQVRVIIRNGANQPIVQRNYYSGQYWGSMYFNAQSLNYTGDGNGNATITLTAVASYTGRFAGSFAQLALSVAEPTPPIYAPSYIPPSLPTSSPTTSGSVIHCAQVSYGNSYEISCPSNHTITSIPFASWGTYPSGQCGTYSCGTDPSCTNGLPIISANCLGRSSCSLPSTCGQFGCWYPAPAGWYATNYAVVEYTCGVATLSTPVCIQVSYGQSASISCPSNEVIVAIPYASWGTAPNGECGNYSAYSGTVTNGLPVVSANCMGRQSCVVPSTCNTFGCYYPGPAGWYSTNYAIIQYKCGLATPSTPVCIQGVAGALATITCPAYEFIASIPFASWGYPPDGQCGSYSLNGGQSSDGLQVIQAACLGQESCTVPTDCNRYNTGCPGPAGWYSTNYAIVQYICKGDPSSTPTTRPAASPSAQPSKQPSDAPTSKPLSKPSRYPTSRPSRQPSLRPSQLPTQQPFNRPSRQPSCQPTQQPSSKPTCKPSTQPSRQPSNHPSRTPSTLPTRQPSSQPSMQPSNHPTQHPSSKPTRQPSSKPSLQPSMQPSHVPSTHPSSQPSSIPISQPTSQPAEKPTTKPSLQPSFQPYRLPSSQPSGQPTHHPSANPSAHPSTQPSRQPTLQPSSKPTHKPTSQPSRQPTNKPSKQPSSNPSRQPSCQPSCSPSMQPTAQPSTWPVPLPTQQPSVMPTRNPSAQPSRVPTSQPTTIPSSDPSRFPSGQPTRSPTKRPSKQPTVQPTTQPTSKPSVKPSFYPSRQPSRQPTQRPTTRPSSQPGSHPTGQPSSIPLVRRTAIPSSMPSRRPTGQPADHPSEQPTTQPSSYPTITGSTLHSHTVTSTQVHNGVLMANTTFHNLGYNPSLPYYLSVSFLQTGFGVAGNEYSITVFVLQNDGLQQQPTLTPICRLCRVTTCGVTFELCRTCSNLDISSIVSSSFGGSISLLAAANELWLKPMCGKHNPQFTVQFSVSENVALLSNLSNPCPVGMFCLNGTLTEPCPPGTYNPNTGKTTKQSACLPCPVGSFNPHYGSDVCYSCPAGTFTTAGAQQSILSCVSTACLAGNYCPGNMNMVPCPAGTSNPNTGQALESSCVPCMPGSVSNTGATSCSACPSGYFSRRFSSQCVPCPAGYTSTGGSDGCTICPAGTQSQIGASACPLCANGQYSYPGSSQCQSCS